MFCERKDAENFFFYDGKFGSSPVEWLPGSNLILELPRGQEATARSEGNGNGAAQKEAVVVEDKWNSPAFGGTVHPPSPKALVLKQQQQQLGMNKSL